MTYNFSKNEVVLWKFNPNKDPIKVKVIGYATTEKPMVESTIIIELNNPKDADIDNKVYPFNVTVALECQLEKIKT